MSCVVSPTRRAYGLRARTDPHSADPTTNSGRACALLSASEFVFASLKTLSQVDTVSCQRADGSCARLLLSQVLKDGSSAGNGDDCESNVHG